MVGVTVFLAVITLAACGGEEQSVDSGASAAGSQSISLKSVNLTDPEQTASIGRRLASQLEVARTPPPKKLVVRDLTEGSGAALAPGDRIHADYFFINYDQLREGGGAGRFYKSADLAFDAVLQGWQKGLPGMRAGGRRELIVPERLGFEGQPLVYLVDLLSVPGSAEGG